MLRYSSHQKGFSLVELAIVLVIISLLFGAVVKVHTLIERARVKQTLKKLDELQASSLTYLDRFNAIPGDDGDSHNGLITPATTNPGDGKIDNPDDYWQQMRDAGLVKGTGTQPLKTPWGTPYTALYGAAGLTNNAVCVMLPADVAREIETRYDDDNGTTGSYRLAADQNGLPGTTADVLSNLPDTVWLCTIDIRKELVGG